MTGEVAFVLAILIVAALVLTAYDMGRTAASATREPGDDPRNGGPRRDEGAPEDGPWGSAWRADDVRPGATSWDPPASPKPAPAGPAARLRRVLVAYDGSGPARRALARGIELATALGASLSVVSVVPVNPHGRVRVEPWDDATVHAGQLEEARAAAASEGLAADLIEPRGQPAEVIERIAEDGDYDAVLVGSHGTNGLVRALRGSVSAHVAEHCRRTVIIVH